jgi:tryptophanyl-tRNA synthetase
MDLLGDNNTQNAEKVMANLRKRDFWKEEEELLLRSWADKAQCYQWMHMRAHEIYSRKNAMYTIPVIIISTITGTANFAQDRFGEDMRPYVVMGIGTLSIVAGIISTISQFLKISELNESHRVASLSWGKFFRNIKTELARHPRDRFPPLEMIKMSKEEYDRLVEISPFMPKKVISMFNTKFRQNLDLTKPEVCDILNATQIFELTQQERDELAREFQENLDKKDGNHHSGIKETTNEEMERRRRFIDTFFEINGRHPDEDEINKLFVPDKNLMINFDNQSSDRISNTFV